MQKINKTTTAILGLAFVLGVAGMMIAHAATSPDLGAADDFAVLAGSFVTDSNPPTGLITGDVGLSPAAGTFYTGLTSAQVSGVIYAVDDDGPDGPAGNNPSLLTSAKNDLTAAYNDAFNHATTDVIAADLGGQTLTPGVYEDNDAPDSLSITGKLTLDAENDPDAFFIFKSGSTLTTAANSEVELINGAQACNVFWQVGSSATLGTNSTFQGNILASESITDNGDSNIAGRLLASTGGVTLNNTTVAKATCEVPEEVSSDDGTRTVDTPPHINVVKVPDPLALPGGSGEVEYTFTLDNIGEEAATDIEITDDSCSPLTFVSGDSNSDDMLDLDETWTYTCSRTLSETHSNIVTATAWSDGLSTTDTASATVVVGEPTEPPLINVTKTPSPFVLPDGGGDVTYVNQVTNPGSVALSDVSVTDNKCGPVEYVSGDANDDAMLDVDETWIYTCSADLDATTSNTVTAEGWANGLKATDIANATVVVSDPLASPVINVTKSPSPSALPNGSGMVTYTNQVTNPGSVALSDVSVTDNKCGPVEYVSGDANDDAMLDVDETWIYTCSADLDATTSNTVTAEGWANGLKAVDTANATVIVGTPQLPDTGLSPAESSIPWNLVVPAGIFGILASLFFVRRKRTN